MVRRVRKTILLYGEGHVGERVFLTHVKKLCRKNHTGFNRDALSIIADSGNYDRCVILMDNDLEWPNRPESFIHGTEVVYQGCTPCLEGYLLELQGKRAPRQSKDCKRQFYGSTDPRAREVTRAIEAAVTWRVLQNSYNGNMQITRCLLDHFDLSKIGNYYPGTVIK